MMLKDTYHRGSFAEPVDDDRKAFQRMYRATFAVFIVIALFSRLLPRAWRPLASTVDANESVFDEAKRAAYTVVPFVFMR